MAAVSIQWNSGRFVSMIAIVSPRPRPSAARPAAVFLTFSAYSAHVMLNSPPLVRMASRSAYSRAVTWNAPQSVVSRSDGKSVSYCSTVLLSIPVLPPKVKAGG
jgi:hypothetical protein